MCKMITPSAFLPCIELLTPRPFWCVHVISIVISRLQVWLFDYSALPFWRTKEFWCTLLLMLDLEWRLEENRRIDLINLNAFPLWGSLIWRDFWTSEGQSWVGQWTTFLDDTIEWRSVILPLFLIPLLQWYIDVSGKAWLTKGDAFWYSSTSGCLFEVDYVLVWDFFLT